MSLFGSSQWYSCTNDLVQTRGANFKARGQTSSSAINIILSVDEAERREKKKKALKASHFVIEEPEEHDRFAGTKPEQRCQGRVPETERAY
jgi:hypothetical protein